MLELAIERGCAQSIIRAMNPIRRMRFTQAFALVLGGLALPAFSYAQRPDQPPRVAPPSCEINLMGLGNVSGSQAYVRLRYEVEALTAAQESLAGMDAALKDLDDSTSPTMGLAGMITGMNQAHDSLTCASYIVGQYRPPTQDDETTSAILVSVFNREANCVSDSLAHGKEQLLRSASQQSNATKLKDAERISARTAAQNQAATDLLEVTTFSLLRAVDTSDAHAKTAEYLAMSWLSGPIYLGEARPWPTRTKVGKRAPTQHPQRLFRRCSRSTSAGTDRSAPCQWRSHG